MKTMNGIDISTLQGKIDWSGVDVDFAMVKASQGRGETKVTEGLRFFTDSRFAENVQNAVRRGIPVGCYHYFTARDVDESLYEAEKFCRVIEPLRKKLKLWAAVDVESPRWLSGLGRAELGKAVVAFTEYVRGAGFEPMIYTNPDFVKNRFDLLPDADIWLAHWGVPKPMTLPRVKIWQYGIGNVDGIGSCDVNIGYFGAEVFYKVGGSYVIRPGDVYSNGKSVPKRLIGKSFTIKRVAENRLLLGEINSWVKI